MFDFVPQREDPLGVLASTAPVAEGARQLRIDGDAVARFAAAWSGRPAPALAEDALHCTFLPQGRFLNYLLALEALNFCFWDEHPRWQVEYGGKSHDGYWALAAALHRAVRTDGLPLWDAAWLAELDAAALERMLRGKGRPPPLMEARLAHLREAGAVLLERWSGRFAALVREAGGEAPVLVRLIVSEFPSFRDEAVWRGRAVRFYKRAQICAADLSRLLSPRPIAALRGLETLTAFADYKVPQVLMAEGILLPAAGLAARLERREELAAGSAEELEIRAATLWACEWIVRALNRERAPDRPAVTAMDVDYLLWAAGQHRPSLPPYHRTRTVFY